MSKLELFSDLEMRGSSISEWPLLAITSSLAKIVEFFAIITVHVSNVVFIARIFFLATE
jgi:hypothetical protein